MIKYTARAILITCTALVVLSGCGSLVKTFAKYDTVEMPRGQFDLTYADVKALVSVAKDRLKTKCADLSNLKNLPKRPDVTKLEPSTQAYIVALEQYKNTGKLSASDCKKFEDVDTALLIQVEQPVRDMIAHPDVQPNWDAIQKFISQTLPILEMAGKAVVAGAEAGVIAIP